MDKIEVNAFKKVYGTLLCLQICLGALIDFACQARETFALCICLSIFCEGAHFVLLPTMLRQVYGESASSIYWTIFTFTGLSNLIIMCIVSSKIGTQYANIYMFSACLSACSLILLLTCFKESKAQT